MEEGLAGKGKRGGREREESRYCSLVNKEECGGKGGVRERGVGRGETQKRWRSEEENARKGTISSRYQVQPTPAPDAVRPCLGGLPRVCPDSLPLTF